MTTPKTNRLATSEEIERINKDADEAERLYFQGGLSDDPLIEAESRHPPQAGTEADPPLILEKTKRNLRS